jgi:hypothetical protein
VRCFLVLIGLILNGGALRGLALIHALSRFGIDVRVGPRADVVGATLLGQNIEAGHLVDVLTLGGTSDWVRPRDGFVLGDEDTR